MTEPLTIKDVVAIVGPAVATAVREQAARASADGKTTRLMTATVAVGNTDVFGDESAEDLDLIAVRIDGDEDDVAVEYLGQPPPLANERVLIAFAPGGRMVSLGVFGDESRSVTPDDGGGDAALLYRAEFQLEDPGEGDARLLFLAGDYEENGPGASIGNYLNAGDALNIDVPGIYSISLMFYANDEAVLDDEYDFTFFGGDKGEAGSYPFDNGFDVTGYFAKSSLSSLVQVSFAWTGWLDALENSITIVLINHGSGVTSGNPTFGGGRFYIQRIA